MEVANPATANGVGVGEGRERGEVLTLGEPMNADREFENAGALLCGLWIGGLHVQGKRAWRCSKDEEP